jgi:hypothetical protein
MNDQAFDFQIDDGVEIPKREIQGRPRGSQYPIERMKQGQSFFLPLTGKEGATKKDKEGNVSNITADEDLQRQMRQKQSYFSQLGKQLGLNLTTRTFDGTERVYGTKQGIAGIAVWHDGERTEKDEAQGAVDQFGNPEGTEYDEEGNPYNPDGTPLEDGINAKDAG